MRRTPRRRRLTKSRLLSVVLMAAGIAALLLPGISDAVVSGSPSSFESNDGNLVVGTSGNADWNCFLGSGTSTAGSGVTCNTSKFNSNNLVVKHPGTTEAASGNELGWKSGQKLDAACPNLVNKASVPNKDDFTDIAQYNEQDSATPPNTYIYGAEIRATANGSSSGNLELNQQADPTGTCQIFRTAGDKLIAFDFQNGGASLSFHALTWITPQNLTIGGNNGTCDIGNDTAPCWGAHVLTAGAGITVGGCGSVTANDVEGCANQSTITAAANGLSGNALAVNQFAEFGVNLTKALQLTGCFPVTQEVWESRSSGSSFTSNPEDIEILNHKINNCGEIKIIKNTNPLGQNQAFGYSTTGGLTPSTFSLNDNGDTAGGQFGTNTQDYSAVPAGAYTVTENASPDGYTFQSLSCSADSGSGSSATPTTASSSTETASITLTANGIVTCTYVNQLNTAGLSTSVSTTAASVFPSTAVHDTATITGNQTADTPGGTVSFYLCGPLPTGSCNSTATSAGSGSLSGSAGVATATSSDVNTSAHPLSPGRYCFEATWPGDSNYPGTLTEHGGAVSTDGECFTVVTISTTTVSSPSLGTGTVNFGSSVTDHDLITAASDGGGTPTGTVAFYVCTPAQVTANGGSCSSTAGTTLDSSVTTAASSPATVPPSSTADSSAITANVTGTWCFASVYTPGGANGSNYTGSNDASSDECFTVTDTTAGSSTQSWLPNDTASVSSAHGAPLNGTLSVQMYTGDNCGVTSGAAVAGQLYTKSLTAATSPASLTTTNTTYTVGTSVSVSWLVTFTSSDGNVSNSPGHCEVTSLTITN